MCESNRHERYHYVDMLIGVYVPVTFDPSAASNAKTPISHWIIIPTSISIRHYNCNQRKRRRHVIVSQAIFGRINHETDVCVYICIYFVYRNQALSYNIIAGKNDVTAG